ncbi:acetylornithine deacetylase [Profundibacterium mesophilum]|uniref:Acetylornithine deacetylase n=1 Tax=Profundibacterium mesophilum KAUST100406-0324 TaxID=1037889 RepID=A0A921TC81_9RHOB|nr:acetylornithine deacetylase [Profundibacterium mesophilum]KAF0674562.1 Acetylornithine deacetylase [Profundibacterium mesophilum KAUST100406-0324]
MDDLDRARDILGTLFAFPTVSHDSNLDLIAHLAERLGEAGARIEIQADESGGKANLFATIGEGDTGGLVLSGHTDVVPVAEQSWSSDPFVMQERDGRLFGRGSCDMKGFIAACVAMAPLLASRRLRKPVHFAFTHDEEVGCLGAQRLVGLLERKGLRPDLVVIGEPTQMKVIEGHKGCCEYSAHFTGLEGHGSAPDRGVNAVEAAVSYVHRLMELKEALKARAPAGGRFDPPWTTINTGALSGGTAHNVIPGRARVDWEMRPVSQADADWVRAQITDHVEARLLPAMRAVHPEATIRTEIIGEVAGLEPMEENAARELMLGLTGQNGAELVAFGTEAGLFQSLGADVVVCGPGAIAQAHRPDEYLETAQLAACLEMLRGLAGRLAA